MRQEIRAKDIIATFVVGMKYQVKSERELQRLLRRMKSGTPVHIRRELKNKHDPNACAVYLGRIKIGYIPRTLSAYLAQRLDSGEKFKFIIFDFPGHALGIEDTVTTDIIGIRVRE